MPRNTVTSRQNAMASWEASPPAGSITATAEPEPARHWGGKRPCRHHRFTLSVSTVFLLLILLWFDGTFLL
jgi:hypothetical protein